jgi:predicted site-specific integrase-resolvase
MSHIHPSQIPLYAYIRNSILGHALLINPSPHGRRELITYPNRQGGWDVQVVVLTETPYECRILAQNVGSNQREMEVMQDMLQGLQSNSRRMLSTRMVGESFRIEERMKKWVVGFAGWEGQKKCA